LDAQGVTTVDGLGKVSFINLLDVYSHASIDSHACLKVSHPKSEDYQRVLRRRRNRPIHASAGWVPGKSGQDAGVEKANLGLSKKGIGSPSSKEEKFNTMGGMVRGHLTVVKQPNVEQVVA
jgi:hypothetical protein